MTSNEQSFRSERAAIIGVNRMLATVCAVFSTVAVGIPVFFGAEALNVAFSLVAVIAAAVAFGQIRAKVRPHFAKGQLEATGKGLSWNGELRVAREDLTQGFALPLGGGCVVRLERRWPRGPMDIAVWDEEEGRRLLAALGLDASQRVADVTTMSAVHSFPLSKKLFAVGLGGAAWVLGSLVGFGFWVAFLLGLAAALAFGRKSRVRIGIDGIHHRWLWVSEFIRFDTVAHIRPLTHEGKRWVEIELKSGDVRRMALVAETEEEESFVYRRIHQAYVDYLARERSGEIEALARGNRSTPQWLEALRRVAVGANADMRTAHVSNDRLWSIVEDPSAQPWARVSAATSLASIASDDDRQRIRVAAATIAEPKLRIAIERAAEPEIDDEALAEALDAVEQRDTKKGD